MESLTVCLFIFIFDKTIYHPKKPGGGTYSIDLYQNTSQSHSFSFLGLSALTFSFTNGCRPQATMTNCEFSKPVAVDASGRAPSFL